MSEENAKLVYCIFSFMIVVVSFNVGLMIVLSLSPGVACFPTLLVGLRVM
jgi:hypothetical protein